MIAPFPDRPEERTRWILDRRGQRFDSDPRQPQAFLIEPERTVTGTIAEVTTIFLTNRECPWHCLMCDLWRHTLTESVPVGAIPAQIDYALASLAETHSATTHPRQIKLYNSGSFFDQAAIPKEDHPAIADRVRDFERVIVECHPALVGNRVLAFRDRLQPQLEVALGLETIQPGVLEKLNKRMTLDDFRRATEFLGSHGIDLRAFVLVKPPFVANDDEAIEWAVRSAAFAFDCGATVVSLIPTRFGNGALETLAKNGFFSPPRLATIESALAQALSLGSGRVFADLWNLKEFSHCDQCFAIRRDHLKRMNLEQIPSSEIHCTCDETC